MWKGGNVAVMSALATCLVMGCAVPRAGPKRALKVPSPEGARQSSGMEDTNAGTMSVIEASRNSCVLVERGPGRGTGFWLTTQHVATCFHVVGKTTVNDTNVPSGWHSVASWQANGASFQVLVADNLKVVTPTGEKLDAELVSLPGKLDRDGAPFFADFAILKVKTLPMKAHGCLSLARAGTEVTIGEEVVFSGFPLDSVGRVGMVTLRGMVCGKSPDNLLFGIESSINQGNSGGAVLTAKGEAIGIITLREGALLTGLNSVRDIIRENQRSGSVVLMGVDPNKAILDLIDTLDKYISVGIGYAWSTESLRKYCENHPYVLR